MAIALGAVVVVLAIVGAWIWVLSWCGFFDRAPDEEEPDQ
jgi:hypothetical protein